MITIVLASNNEKKAREMRSFLPGRFHVITAAQAGIGMPDETGETFEDNALIKAREAARQSGHLCVADDSGLEVDILKGQPGVRSARFAADRGRPSGDEENNRLLLELLEDVEPARRTGRFVSAVAIVAPSGDEAVVRGTVEGTIGTFPLGSNGFGYDPLFLPEGSDRTMAELSEGEKNQISHRGRAFRAAISYVLRFSEASARGDATA